MTKSLLTALAVLLSLTSFAQAQDHTVLTANVSGTVTFSSMEVGCKKLDDVMDQSSAKPGLPPRPSAARRASATAAIVVARDYASRLARMSFGHPSSHAQLSPAGLSVPLVGR